jgi:hypothetical protein
MRRSAMSILSIVSAGLLSGCTGTGVFLDHTTQWFGANPNTPAGSSETFLRIRGENVDVPPLVPENGNVWPTDAGPDLTMQDIEKQQNEQIRRGGGQPITGPANGPNPQVNRANNADQGLPPPQTAPSPPRRRGVTPTPGGPSLDVGGGTGRGYRQLQSPGAPNGGTGILVPNGNGTSTLIGPDGSVQTVPTK